MLYVANTLNYPDCIITFTVHTYSSDKQFSAVISQNDKHIAFFLKKITKPQRNYTKTEKELFSVVECLN